MDEREKLRKFRELDDAFAEALKSLEGSGESAASRHGRSEISAQARECRRGEEKVEEERIEEERKAREEVARKAQQARDAEFSAQLHRLMKEYSQTSADVHQVVRAIEEHQRRA